MGVFKKSRSGNHIASDIRQTSHEAEPAPRRFSHERETIKKGKANRGKAWVIVLIVVAILVLLAGIAYAMFARYYSMLDVKKASPVPEETIVPQAEDIEAIDPADLEAAKPDESWDFNGKDVMNILFIGVDNENLNTMQKRGNADGQLLVSINNTTKQVVMTSFMRDLSASVGDAYRTKLSRIYHNGGVQALLEAYEHNFNIHVDNYILLNYLDLINIIDAFGGVTLDVSQEELYYMGFKIKSLNSFLGRPIPTDLIDTKDAGVMTLNGVQTVAYLRIRNTKGADAARTERLRKVAMQLKEQAQQMSLKELDTVVTKILPNIETDLSQTTILLLMKNAFSILKYEFITQRIPIEGTYDLSNPAFVTIDFKKNNEFLYYTIYEGHKPE